MRANPGGEIAPSEVVGRDRLIQRIRQALEQQSVILVAERRMGKTCVNKKMAAERPEDILIINRDVGAVDTPIGFAQRLCNDAMEHLSRAKKTAGRLRALLKHLGGIEIGGVVKLPEGAAPHWQTLLERTLEDLAEHKERTVILMWDELPFMLQKISRSAGDTTAMAVLDTLRTARQMHPRLRMIYTGSIGLHHVTASLKEAGHASAATNDMRVIDVPPLSPDDARFLALELITGEQLKCADPESTATRIAQLVDNIPFYIHFVVSAMKDTTDVVSADLAEQIVTEALVDPQDTWHLFHYLNRLKDYYDSDLLPVVLTTLDELSIAKGPLAFDDLSSGLPANLEPGAGALAKRFLAGDREILHNVLLLLQRDHYLIKQPADSRFRFRFSLIQRWWRIGRNLE